MGAVNLKKHKNNIIAEMKVSYIAKQKISERPQITSSADSYKVLQQCFSADTINYSEEFILLLLNKANRLIGWVKISAGGIAGTVCDQRIIFAIALQTGATSIILAHNHPSGSLRPSEPDIALTKKIKEGGEILDIQLLDHLILTDDNFYSFADDGIL